jgi:hypothetical protein
MADKSAVKSSQQSARALKERRAEKREKASNRLSSFESVRADAILDQRYRPVILFTA